MIESVEKKRKFYFQSNLIVSRLSKIPFQIEIVKTHNLSIASSYIYKTKCWCRFLSFILSLSFLFISLEIYFKRETTPNNNSNSLYSVFEMWIWASREIMVQSHAANIIISAFYTPMYTGVYASKK